MVDEWYDDWCAIWNGDEPDETDEQIIDDQTTIEIGGVIPRIFFNGGDHDKKMD